MVGIRKPKRRDFNIFYWDVQKNFSKVFCNDLYAIKHGLIWFRMIIEFSLLSHCCMSLSTDIFKSFSGHIVENKKRKFHILNYDTRLDKIQKNACLKSELTVLLSGQFQ